jgi:hypothetical protein
MNWIPLEGGNNTQRTILRLGIGFLPNRPQKSKQADCFCPLFPLNLLAGGGKAHEKLFLEGTKEVIMELITFFYILIS